jgi:hypothetical protein
VKDTCGENPIVAVVTLVVFDDCRAESVIDPVAGRLPGPALTQ